MSDGQPKIPFAERIVAAGQPPTDQFERLRSEGFGTVINTRGHAEAHLFEEEEGNCTSAGLVYKWIPVDGANGLNETNARKLAAALEAAPSGKILVHCASGERVGGLLALKANLVDGFSAEAALEYGQRNLLYKMAPYIARLLS